jgi:23S rRNA (adenine2503-C2)-methyltransferase
MELLGKSKNELRDFCVSLGEPAYRGGQLYHALYAERKVSVREISNLPAALRERLEAETTLPTVRRSYTSQDGSVRYLFGLSDSGADAKRKSGPASVEAVFMPSSGRQTLCISTQAGCAVDCHFCLTAQLGLIRNLTPAEILSQILLPLERHKSQLAPQTNLVLMGQGEPLLNFDAVMAALRIVLDPEGLALSPKHVTLSTSGIVP